MYLSSYRICLMIFFKNILLLGLLGAANAAPTSDQSFACGELNVIFTGLPAYHPLVKQQGFDSAMVNRSMHADFNNILNAGYNIRVVLFGPETNVTILGDQSKGVEWSGMGVGYGVRGSRREDITIQFENIIEVYREKGPNAAILFSYSPDTALWSIQRKFPMVSNCTNTPGKNLGFNIICDSKVCAP